MNQRFASLMLFFLLLTGSGCGGEAAEDAPQDNAPEQTASSQTLRFLIPKEPAYVGEIAAIESGGHVRLQPDRRNPGPPEAEGDYLAMLYPRAQPERLPGTKLLRVKQVSVEEGDQVTIEIAESAAKQLNEGAELHLFQPSDLKASEVATVPDIVAIEISDQGPGGQLVNRIGAIDDIRRIGLALHSYYAAHQAFPPAVVYGPDGKPWHSWRVLLLPFLEQSALYEQYRLDEPWNGPNNRELLEKIPQVYVDSTFGDRPATGDAATYTNYAAAVSPRAVFNPQGQTMSDAKTDEFEGRGAGFAGITDGSSNTIVFGQVPTDRKIPWTKPDDVFFEENYARPGQPNSFAAPYEAGEVSVGLVVFADTSIAAIPDDINQETWRNFIQRNDGNPVTRPEVKLPGESANAVMELKTGPQPSATVFYE